MSESRRQVLGSIRRALGGSQAGMRDREAAARRLAVRPLGPVPARGLLEPEARLALFQAMAEEAAATVVRLDSPDGIPAAVAQYLATENIPAEIRLAPDPDLRRLPWSDRPLLTVTSGISDGNDAVSVTKALGGVAETGTLALVSGPDTPTTLNLLPEAHIVVRWADAVVGSYEEIWAALRARFGAGAMPRTVNFVTGPSRSADIEQKLQMGAHGPRRLHILLVDRDDPSRGQAPRSGPTPPDA